MIFFPIVKKIFKNLIYLRHSNKNKILLLSYWFKSEIYQYYRGKYCELSNIRKKPLQMNIFFVILLTNVFVITLKVYWYQRRITPSNFITSERYWYKKLKLKNTCDPHLHLLMLDIGALLTILKCSDFLKACCNAGW